MKNFDPISLFLNKIKVDVSAIKDFIIGKKYACVVLNNGNIGLAANIFNVSNFDFRSIQQFDTENYTHRLFLLAYFNARLNCEKNEYTRADIFNVINFKKYKKIVMIGYSQPMYEKLKKMNIEPVVFDYSSDESFITEQNLLSENLKNANSVILTGTSIINNSFNDILKDVGNACDVFLIGPSVPLSKELFETEEIKGIFGTIFEENRQMVIDLIKQDKGTNCLKKYGKKVVLMKT